MAAKRKKSTIKLEPWKFNPTTLKSLELSDLKKIYSEKRDIAQKRIKRLQKSDFKKTNAALAYKSGVPTLKSIRAESEKDKELEKNILVYELSKLQNFLGNKYSKVSELKKTRDKAIDTLHKHGYDFVTKSNYNEFIDFMNYLHNTQLDRIYSKVDTGSGYKESQSDKVDTDAATARELFNQWKNNKKTLPSEYFIYR